MSNVTTKTTESSTETAKVIVPEVFASLTPNGVEVKRNGEATSLTLGQMEETLSTVQRMLDKKGKLNNATRDALRTFRDNLKSSYESVGKTHQLVAAFDPPRHPYSTEFGDMTTAEFQDLVTSMQVNGYLEEQPIDLLDGQILDGWHRYNAAKEAGVEPKFRNFTGKDPISYVKALNADRRHLTDNQRAQIAESLSKLSGETIKQVAEKFKVSTNMVTRSRYVADRSDVLASAVKSGLLDLHDAQIVARNDNLLGKVNGSEFDIESDLDKIVSSAKKIDKQTQKRTALSRTLPLEGVGCWQLEDEVFDEKGNSLGCGYVLQKKSKPVTSDDIVDYAKQAWDSGNGKLNKKLVRPIISSAPDDLLVSIANVGGKSEITMSSTRQEMMVSATEVIMESGENHKKVWEAASESTKPKAKASPDIMSEEDIENILATLE